jgi:hypothetical protein
MSVEVLHSITLLQVIVKVEILAILLHLKSVGVVRIWCSKAIKVLMCFPICRVILYREERVD